jgi:hypothetical protein
MSERGGEVGEGAFELVDQLVTGDGRPLAFGDHRGEDLVDRVPVLIEQLHGEPVRVGCGDGWGSNRSLLTTTSALAAIARAAT